MGCDLASDARRGGEIDAAGDLVIRPAVAGEQRLIRTLVRSAGLTPIHLHWPNFLMAERMEATGPRLVGMGQLRPHRGGYLELASMLVLPEARGQGVGSRLVSALIHKADRPLYLICEGAKVPFYARFGFVEINEVRTLPGSLRWIRRLAGWVEPLMGLFSNDPRHLAVMAHLKGAQKSGNCSGR